jgi:hypothetical protein
MRAKGFDGWWRLVGDQRQQQIDQGLKVLTQK